MGRGARRQSRATASLERLASPLLGPLTSPSSAPLPTSRQDTPTCTCTDRTPSPTTTTPDTPPPTTRPPSQATFHRSTPVPQPPEHISNLAARASSMRTLRHEIATARIMPKVDLSTILPRWVPRHAPSLPACQPASLPACRPASLPGLLACLSRPSCPPSLGLPASKGSPCRLRTVHPHPMTTLPHSN